MPSSVWNLSPRSSPSTSAAIASGWSPAGARSVTSSNSGTRRAYRRGVTVTSSRSARLRGGSAAVGSSRSLLELGPDRVDLALEARRGRRRCRRTHVATSRRSSSVACSAIRRSASSRGTPRASSRSSRTSRGASTTITAPYSKPRVDSTSSGTSCTTIPSGGRLGDPAQELLADRRMRDRLELLARLVGRRTPARRARAGRASRRAARISGPNALDQRGERRRARLDHLPRDRVGVDRRPRPARRACRATVDFPDPMPPVSPTMSTAASLRAARARPSWPRRGRALRIRSVLPTKRVKPDVNARRPAPGGAHCGPTQPHRKVSAAWRPRWRRATTAAPRIEARLVRLTVTTRWVTILAGILFGVLRHPSDHFARRGDRARRVRRRSRPSTSSSRRPPPRIRLLVRLRARAHGRPRCTVTGGLASPFVLTPVTGLAPRRLRVGPAGAGRHRDRRAHRGRRDDRDAVGRRRPTRGAAGQIAVVFLLCGALGAFTRNLIAEIESHRAAAIDQAAEMATANELLVSLHALAQTLPASFDLARGRRVDPPAAAVARPLHRARRARARRRAVGVDRRARRRRAAARRT